MCPASPGEPQCTHIWGPAAVWSVYVSRRLCLSLSICFSVCLLVSAATHAQFVVMPSAVVNGNCPPRGLGGQFHPSFGDCFALRPTSTTHMSPIQKFKNKCPPRGLGGQFGPLWGASKEALERLWRGSWEAPERACATLCAHSVHTLRRGRLWRPFWAPFRTLDGSKT